jgi:neutral ceramidase
MLRAGFARVEITPGRECSLIGYEFRYRRLPAGNEGVHDPLYARALVLDDGQAPAALVSLDLAIATVDVARHLRGVVASQLGTTPERVLLGCTHTHSGPFPRLKAPARRRGHKPYPARPEARRWKADIAYARLLQQRVEEAVARAGGLLYRVQPGAAEAPLGLGYVRRVRTREGIRHCWNPQEFPDLSPAGSPDPACTVLQLRQTDGPRRYLLWSAGAHPVVLGKTSRLVSGDWPGRACELIERATSGARSMFFLGACGDTHPWIATQEDPAQIEPVAAAAAGIVSLLTHAIGSAGNPDAGCLRIAARTLVIGGTELDVAVWRLGNARIIAAPVELFSELGAELRRRLPGPLLLATNTNGWTGYWPTAAAFAEGGYEVDGARAMGRQPGDSERLMEELVALAGGLERGASVAVSLSRRRRSGRR